MQVKKYKKTLAFFLYIVYNNNRCDVDSEEA